MGGQRMGTFRWRKKKILTGSKYPHIVLQKGATHACSVTCRHRRHRHTSDQKHTAAHEAGSDPRRHLWVTWGVYPCAGKPPLADIILSHPADLTRCDSVIGLAILAMSGHIQYRGAAS